MEFCPECGSMLLPTEDNELKCSCGYTKKLSKDKSEIGRASCRERV